MSDRLREAVTRGLKFLEQASGAETFTWKGASVLCVASTEGRGTLIDERGNPVTVELTLFVRKANFLTADSTIVSIDSTLYTADSDMPHPVAGRHLTFRGRSYVILVAREGAYRGHYELVLGDAKSTR